jgi:O-antigen/teichoic acid export membrane protein
MALYSRKRARRSLFDTVIYRAISQVVTILGYIILVRGMTEREFGVFNLLYAFLPVISTVASLGLEQTLRRYQPEYLSSGNKAAAFWLVRFVGSARFGVSVVLLSLILLTWNYFAPVFKLGPYRAQFALFSFLVLLHFQARVLQLSLASHMLHRYSVGSTVALSTGKLIAYALLFSSGSLSLQNVIIADTAAYAITYLLLVIAYRRRCLPDASAKPHKPAPEERRRLFRYGFYNSFNDAGTFMLGVKSDNFFIAAFIDPVSVGVYAFYQRLNEMALHLMPVRMFDNVIQPVFFAVQPSAADRSIPQYFSLLLNMSLLVQMPVLAFSIIYHSELVDVIFGGKFVEDSWLLPLVVGFTTINVIATPVTLVAQYEEKAAIILLSKLFVIYNVAALLILLPVAGLYGAAIATGTAQVMKSLYIWWHVRRRAVWTNFASVLSSSLLIWGGAVAVCYAVKDWIRAPGIVQMLLGAAICGLAALAHLRSPAISAADRTILGSMLRGKEAFVLRRLGLLAPMHKDQLGAGQR